MKMEITEYVKQEKERIREEVSGLRVAPYFTIIQVNEDEGSNIYIAGKIKDAQELGINVQHMKCPLDMREEDLLRLINDLNHNKDVHGIIVQLPLPPQINPAHVKCAIDPAKDIDGFNPLSHFTPCTPRGILDYLKEEEIEIDGKNCVVIGRSDIVGKPMAKVLLNENGNVTTLHSHTSKEDMKKYVAMADIIVIAIGHKHFLDDSFTFKESAVIVDVGITREDGKLHGDSLPGLPVRLQTPVPKGVGLLTRLSLMKNLMEAYYELQD
ncbi:MAG: bifunctional 5,10-methylenetetrahydrofolate dehydrogenase/5,10-methenyltetrahydrofolate cyclohydrolase [Coprobacillus sp.]|nr:bifunctional 5,10-methylenetetrahydrofolate dehydrogenase/5,10-methenyltetrahydrofolate cyclohydrolase [Coprobacillus sp.]